MSTAILNLKGGLERFSQDEEFVRKQSDNIAKLEDKMQQYAVLKEKYSSLFERQFKEVLDKGQLKELKILKSQIHEIVEPQFEDLNNYFKFRIILDFISGMTDQYALNHYQKISGQKIN